MIDYVVLTAARNEEEYIEHTLSSVINQTVKPLRWVIVSDGSTDRTDEIVQSYAAEYAFIELIRTDGDRERNFGSKAKAIAAAYESVCQLEHSVVAILDADISFAPDYYQLLLPRFEEDPKLGVGGGTVRDLHKGNFSTSRMSTDWSVRGPIQMFRRECFDQIGGYRTLRYGGVDAVAETMARMYGWRVRTFPVVFADHHRPTGTESQSKLKALFRLGCQNFVNGYHPLFMLGRCLARLSHRPYILNGLLLGAGYSWAALTGQTKEVPPDVIRFLRSEQVSRLLVPWRQQSLPKSQGQPSETADSEDL